MTGEIIAFARAQTKAAARRAAYRAAFALVSGLFVVFAAAGLFAALFFWLEPQHGSIEAALICTAAALALAVLALVPLAFQRRPSPLRDGPTAQLAAVMAKAAANVAPGD